MSGSPTTQEFLEVRNFFGLPSIDLVEKDWHILRAMQALDAVDDPAFRLVFAGGTCLARAHRLVRRMSEDIDYKLVERELGAIVSKSRRRKQLGDLRIRICDHLKAAGFHVNPDQVRSRDDNHYLLFQLPYENANLAGAFLRPTIQVELSYTSLRLPSVALPLSSFVTEAFKRPAEIPSIACVSVTETAAEKLVSLTRRTAMELAGLSRKIDPTLIRHVYDLHAIRKQVDPAMVGALSREIARADADAFKSQHPAYADDIAGESRKALDSLRTDPDTAKRYAQFVAAMVYESAPSYERALATVVDLAGDLISQS